MRKGRDEEKKWKMEKEIEIDKMTFLLATNIAASRPPKRRTTGTLTTRANLIKSGITIDSGRECEKISFSSSLYSPLLSAHYIEH